MHEILKDSWSYQQMVQQGALLTTQQPAINIIVARFTDLETLARTKITAIGDLEDASYIHHSFATLSSVFSYLETYPYGKHQQLKAFCEPFFREHVGAISTHDLELVKLVDVVPQVKNYHSREEVIDGRLVFDYILRPGPCPTTNALKIMQMEGLPVEDSSELEG